MTAPPTATRLGWLLTRFAQETPLVSHVLAISADGLTLAQPSSAKRRGAGRVSVRTRPGSASTMSSGSCMVGCCWTDPALYGKSAVVRFS